MRPKCLSRQPSAAICVFPRVRFRAKLSLLRSLNLIHDQAIGEERPLTVLLQKIEQLKSSYLSQSKNGDEYWSWIEFDGRSAYGKSCRPPARIVRLSIRCLTLEREF
jgi:hypothetical protein